MLDVTPYDPGSAGLPQIRDAWTDGGPDLLHLLFQGLSQMAGQVGIMVGVLTIWYVVVTVAIYLIRLVLHAVIRGVSAAPPAAAAVKAPVEDPDHIITHQAVLDTLAEDIVASLATPPAKKKKNRSRA